MNYSMPRGCYSVPTGALEVDECHCTTLYSLIPKATVLLQLFCESEGQNTTCIPCKRHRVWIHL